MATARPEDQVFFVYDHTVLQREEDDLKDAIVYFFPSSIPLDDQCALCGQLMGMVEFFNEFTGAAPRVYILQKNKLAVKHLGRFTLVLSGNKKEATIVLQRQLDSFFNVFMFYQGGFSRLLDRTFVKKENFNDNMQIIWDSYLPFIRRYGDTISASFESLSHVELPKSGNLLFLRASHLLQYASRIPGIHSGCVLFKNRILCSLLTPSLSSRLLIIRPQQAHFPCEYIKPDFGLPAGVRLLVVHLSPSDYKTLISASEKLKNKGHSCRKPASRSSEYLKRAQTFHAGATAEDHGQSFAKPVSKLIRSRSEYKRDGAGHAVASPGLIQPVMDLCEEMSQSGGNPETLPSDSSETAKSSGTLPNDSAGTAESAGRLFFDESAGIQPTASYEAAESAGMVATSCNGTVELVGKQPDDASGTVESPGILPSESNGTAESADAVDSESARIAESTQNGGGDRACDTVLQESNDGAVGGVHPSLQTDESLKKHDVDDISSECQAIAQCHVASPPLKADTADLFRHVKKMAAQGSAMVESMSKSAELDSQADSEEDKQEFVNKKSDTNHDQAASHPDVSTQSINEGDLAEVSSSETLENSQQIEASSLDVETSSASSYHHQLIDKHLVVQDDLSSSSGLEGSGQSHAQCANPAESGTAPDAAKIDESSENSLTESCALEQSTSSRRIPFQLKKTRSRTASLSHSEKQESDLVKMDLYVQGNSDTILVLFMDQGSAYNKELITRVWQSTLPQLGDLELGLKHTLDSTPNEDEQKLEYNYLMYNSCTKTLSGRIAVAGNTLQPMRARELDFCDTAIHMHEEFQENPSLRDMTVRNHGSCIYGHTNKSQEIYFQSREKSRFPLPSGIPSSRDTSMDLETKAFQQLWQDKKIHII